MAAHPTVAADPTSWMSQLQDKRINELCIPGTHDSGTEGFPAGPSRTQFYKINEQLAGGVRFLDMRLSYVPAEDNFHVVHSGDVLSYLNFDTVVEWCNTFLTQNPSETIAMSIKQEGSWPASEDGFAHLLTDWHDRHSSQGDWKPDLWYTNNTAIPTVTDAKSQIILLRRYTVTPLASGTAPLFFGGFNLACINSNQTGSMFPLVNNPSPTPTSPNWGLTWQDQYELDPEQKKTAVMAYLDQMGCQFVPGPPNWMNWTLNFASTSNAGMPVAAPPFWAAEVVDQWLQAQLGDMPGKLCGVLLTDFGQPDLWQQIYGFSFR